MEDAAATEIAATELTASNAELTAATAELTAAYAELTAASAELTAAYAELTAAYAELTAADLHFVLNKIGRNVSDLVRNRRRLAVLTFAYRQVCLSLNVTLRRNPAYAKRCGLLKVNFGVCGSQ